MYRHACSLKRYTEVLAEGCLVLCDIQSSLFFYRNPRIAAQLTVWRLCDRQWTTLSAISSSCSANAKRKQYSSTAIMFLPYVFNPHSLYWHTRW